MPTQETKTTRDRIEADLLQQVGNEVEETLLLHAPEHWQWATCDEIERQILGQTRANLAAQTNTELQSPGTLRQHVSTAVAITKQLCCLDREQS